MLLFPFPFRESQHGWGFKVPLVQTPCSSRAIQSPGPCLDTFWYLQAWGLHRLSEQTVPVLGHPYSEKGFPDVHMEPPVFQFVPGACHWMPLRRAHAHHLYTIPSGILSAKILPQLLLNGDEVLKEGWNRSRCLVKDIFTHQKSLVLFMHDSNNFEAWFFSEKNL